MSDESMREVADRRFDAALRQSGARDPRDFYRERLRTLRSQDERAFRKALDHFENVLVPGIASADSDPIGEWLDYGCLLAALLEPGSAVRIDRSGRSQPYRRPVPVEDLVLHLPTSSRSPAVAVGIPPELSPAQRATYSLLVRGAAEPPSSRIE